MAFVYEREISKSDNEKYGIDELNIIYERSFLPMSCGWGWTIDRERDCYLRFLKFGRWCEEWDEERISYYSFYSNDIVRVIRFQTEGGGSRQTTVWKKYYIKKITPPIDDLVASQKEQFFAVLKEALIAFGDAGAFSRGRPSEARFDF